jgi:hypothetical protein|tara:strand:+ start:1966 stop:2364 length:399 start_codon:yes stop_codon:yes gene_type:complete
VVLSRRYFFFTAQGLQALAAQGFLAAQGLQALAEQGFLAAHGFLAAQGLQARLGAQPATAAGIMAVEARAAIPITASNFLTITKSPPIRSISADPLGAARQTLAPGDRAFRKKEWFQIAAQSIHVLSRVRDR